jgi:hypothetical protein
MLSRARIAALLDHQAQAYALLMWLAEHANHAPALLAPAVVAQLREPTDAAAWLTAERDGALVGAPVPRVIDAEFATLLASFFATSFQVKHLEFDGRLVEARLIATAAAEVVSHVSAEASLALAIKHLAASEDLAMTQDDARRIAKLAAHRQAALIWTYAWELDRRARNKGKGPIVRAIWRSIAIETRKALTVEHVWAARAALLDACRARRAE